MWSLVTAQSEQVAQLCTFLGAAQKILVFTGAGISTGSGIPDFRGPGGVWERRQPVYFDDFVASEEARLEHWEFKAETWAQLRNARPNRVHLSIVKLERSGRLHRLLTQNVDGLHFAAGSSVERTIEIHGSNARVECLTCQRQFEPDPVYSVYAEHHHAPRCGDVSECPSGGLLKPATISFGQALRREDLAAAEAAALECDLVVALGSTLGVYPAAGFPLLAAHNGAQYVIINCGPTDHDGRAEVSLRIDGDVADLFPQAVDAAFPG